MSPDPRIVVRQAKKRIVCDQLWLPLAVGVFGTMGILQVGSSEYWTWYPWTYPLMAANGSTGAHQHLALLLAAGVGALLFAATTLVLGRREVAA